MISHGRWVAICAAAQAVNLGFAFYFARHWIWKWKGLGWLPPADDRAQLLENCKQEIIELVARNQIPDWGGYKDRVEEHFDWIGDRLRNQATTALALGLLCTLVYIAFVVGHLDVPERTAEAKLASLLGETQHSLWGTLIGVVAHLIIVFLLLYRSESSFRAWSRDFMAALKTAANGSGSAAAPVPSSPFPSPSPSPESGPPADRPSAPLAAYANPAGTKMAQSSPTPPYATEGDSLRAVEGAMTDVHHELHRFPSALADEIEKTAAKLGEAFGREARHAQWETTDQTRRHIDQLLNAADERDRKFLNNMTTLVQELVDQLIRSQGAKTRRKTGPVGEM